MPYKLLLADDSVTIQRVIELTFADEDIQVVAVSDGDQAIARLEDADPPDIVLADVGMPGRDGYEVANYVKKSARLAHIPVVLLTGAFEPVDQARADAVGCDGVLAKPFEPQLVIGRVKELLAQSGRVPALVSSNASPPGATERWPSPAVDPPLHVAPPAAAQPANEDYFDRLDAAFATLSTGPAPAAKPAGEASASAADVIDWFGLKPGAAPPGDLPLSYGSPRADFDASGASGSSRAALRDARPPAPRLEPVQPQARPAAAPPPPPPVLVSVSHSAPRPGPALPPLADAFAALLAAEQSAPAAETAPAWPAGAALPAVVTDELIEQVTRRVLERLTDRVVRDTASEMILAVAERLVREEIERIKGAIK